jgi:peptide/nickel transport system substrate-binding protein
MHRRSMWLLVGAALAAMSLSATGAAAVSGPSAKSPATAAAKVGGTVIFGQDQEPQILNWNLTGGDLFATTEIEVPVFDAGLRYNQKAKLQPLMLTGQPKIVKLHPFTTTHTYKKAAKWSDGKPVTGADFVFTWKTTINKKWDIVSRTGYEDIKTVKASGKKVTIVWRKPYAAWNAIDGDVVLPAHALSGQNFNNVWRNDFNNPKTGKPIGSGPYLFSSWQKGQQIRLVRNPNYWGQKARVAQLVYRQLPNTNTQFQALRSGEINILRPQPQLQIADIKKDKRFKVQQGPEYSWEHLDFQQGKDGHPALKQAYVRRAFAKGINRAQIATALYQTIAPGLPVLNNAIFKNFEPQYKPNWKIDSFSQQGAINILRAHKCTGGPAKPSASNRSIYSCPGVGKLSFKFTCNCGANQLRGLTFQIIQKQLLSVGIDLNARVIPSLQPTLSNGNWEIFMFAWISSPLSVISDDDLHGCGGDQNYMNYCNKSVTKLLQKAKYTPLPAKRTAILNQADLLMAKDTTTLPLFARPGFLINRTNIRGATRNPTQATTFWNVNKWTVG